MRRLLPLLSLIALPLFAAPSTAVRGRVMLGDSAVIGVRVTLAGRTLVTDDVGSYEFEDVPPGLQVVQAVLEEYGSTETVIEVKEGETLTFDAHLPAPDLATLTDSRPCVSEEPRSMWDRPTCADYDLDTALIESAQRGDRSAIDLLEQRYASASTHTQRIRLAETLLGRVPDDRTIWRELEGHAEIAVRFFDGSEHWKRTFETYCAEHDYPADEYDTLAWNALVAAGSDKRSRTLLLRALKSNELTLVYTAIDGLARQKDASSLASIGKALHRFPNDAWNLTSALKAYQLEAADALALQFLDEEEREAYLAGGEP